MKITTNAPVHTGTVAGRICLGLGTLGAALALLSAPTAGADPADPVAPSTVLPAGTDTQTTATAPGGDTGSAPGADSSAAPAAVQHLSSPENLPPGTTDTPPQGRLNYLRDLLHAIRTQDVSGSDALLLLAQRPLDANPAPPPGVSLGPTGPVGSSAVAPPAPDAPQPLAADPATP